MIGEDEILRTMSRWIDKDNASNGQYLTERDIDPQAVMRAAEKSAEHTYDVLLPQAREMLDQGRVNFPTPGDRERRAVVACMVTEFTTGFMTGLEMRR